MTEDEAVRATEAVLALIEPNTDHWRAHWRPLILAAIRSARVTPRSLAANRFDCPECGAQGVPVDEDGCCNLCGGDATAIYASDTGRP